MVPDKRLSKVEYRENDWAVLLHLEREQKNWIFFITGALWLIPVWAVQRGPLGHAVSQLINKQRRTFLHNGPIHS